jgi:O-antigen ligase
MASRSRMATPGATGVARLALPEIPVNLSLLTPGLLGVSLYLWSNHSFKLAGLASVAIVFGLLGVLTAPKRAQVTTPVAIFAAFVAWSALGIAFTRYPSVVGETLVDNLKLLLIFFVASNVAGNLSQLSILVGSWVLMFGLYPARGTYMNFFAGINEFGRYFWNFTFSNPNDLAGYAILVMALSGFLFLGRHSKLIRMAAMASLFGLAVLVILTQSRGAFLGLSVGFFLLMVRSKNRKRMLLAAGIGIGCITAVAPEAVWERFSRMKYLTDVETIGEADSSAEQRYLIMQIAMTIAKANPGMGVGLGAYPEAHAQYASQRDEWSFGAGNRDAHDMYLLLASETGIPGLLVFLSMIGVVARRGIRTEKLIGATYPREAEQLRVLRFGLLAFMIAAIFGSFHRPAYLYLYLAILWSACEHFSLLMRAPVPQALPAADRMAMPRLRGYRVHAGQR